MLSTTFLKSTTSQGSPKGFNVGEITLLTVNCVNVGLPKMSEKTILLALSPSPILATERDIKYFVDRAKEARILLDSLIYRRNVLLAGERGSGKSSLLSYVQFRQRDQSTIMIIPITFGWNIKTPEEFVSLLFTRTLQEAEMRLSLKEKTSSFVEKLLTSERIHKSLRSNLNIQVSDKESVYSPLELFEKLASFIRTQGINISYFVDDADKFSEPFYNVTSSLRDFLWHTGTTYAVSADVSLLHLYKKPPLDAFFDEVILLHDLSLEETEKLINARAQGKVTHEVCKMIYEATSGNPRETIVLTQEIIENAIRNVRESSAAEGREIDFESINLSVSARNLISHIESTYSKRRSELQELNRNEQRIVEYLMNHGPSSSSESEFQAYVGVKRARLVQLLKILERKGTLKSIRRGKKKLFVSKYSKTEVAELG